MKLTILGSGSGIIKKDRQAPGYLVELDSGETLLFDCGGTTIQQFTNINFDYLGLDHILISHPHADHLGGFMPLIFAIKLKSMYSKHLGIKERTKTLFLYGYPGFFKDYKLLRKMMSPEPDETYPIKVIEYKNQKVQYPGFTLETKLVPHAEKYYKNKCLAFRLEADGKSFIYSGDSKYCKQLGELAKNADLALIDSSGLGEGLGEKGYHITPEGVGKVAQESGVKKLILTHHYEVKSPQQIIEEARKYYSGEIILAEDLMEIKI